MTDRQLTVLALAFYLAGSACFIVGSAVSLYAALRK